MGWCEDCVWGWVYIGVGIWIMSKTALFVSTKGVGEFSGVFLERVEIIIVVVVVIFLIVIIMTPAHQIMMRTLLPIPYTPNPHIDPFRHTSPYISLSSPTIFPPMSNFCCEISYADDSYLSDSYDAVCDVACNVMDSSNSSTYTKAYKNGDGKENEGFT